MAKTHIICPGLGGTSLLNANVFLKADKKTMEMDEWPEELNEEGALDPCTRPKKWLPATRTNGTQIMTGLSEC